MHREVNKEQLEAIKHGGGPAMILAGPGSGKTFVLTNRIKYMIESYHISPENILVITFTKAASIEMKERFDKLMNGANCNVQFGTFHAVFFHILQNSCQFQATDIITEKEKKEYLEEILPNHEYDNEWIHLLLLEISIVKNLGIAIETYHSVVFDEVKFRKIYKDYRALFLRRRKLDFDDMVLKCFELLKNNREIREFWHNQYKYVLIDEFQDINRMQYETIKLLVAPTNHIFAVGDDDQSIYGFRGSDPRILKQFPIDFPNTRQIVLGINYRSTKNIVDTALKVIHENKMRYKKKIQSYKGEGEPVLKYGFKNREEEIENIVHLIKGLYVHGFPYHEIAVILRTNKEMEEIADKLVFSQIPFQMRDNINGIYEHFVVKDILAYLKFAFTGRRKDFFQIMNKPMRYLSRNACRDEQISFQELKKVFATKPMTRNRIQKLEYDIQMISRMNPYAAIHYIRKGIGYDTYLEGISNNQELQLQKWMDILNHIQEKAASFETNEEWLKHVEKVSAEFDRKRENRKKSEEGKGVQILSMHASKGLEYRVVIIPDINEGTIPHNKAVTEENIEEERRLFYVAITRAKERLFLFYVSNKQEQKEPSRFLHAL